MDSRNGSRWVMYLAINFFHSGDCSTDSKFPKLRFLLYLFPVFDSFRRVEAAKVPCLHGIRSRDCHHFRRHLIAAGFRKK